MSRGRRWVRRLAGLLVLAAIGAAAVYGPQVLRRTEAFRVTRVHVVGTRFVDPLTVVRAAGLDRPANLFDDADAWRTGAQGHPLVDEVRVRRSFPSTVTLEVRESEPVALVALGTLLPVDANGRVLELDPAGELLDLPILTDVETRAGRLVGASASAVRSVAALLQEMPEVAGRLSQVRVEGPWIRLVFRDNHAHAMLPAAATSRQLMQLQLALVDLRARGELDRVRAIDVRYRDQVVVSFLDRSVG